MKFAEYFGILYEGQHTYPDKPRSTQISKEQFEVLFKTHCTEYIPDNQQLYRGSRSFNSSFIYSDPRYHERISANTASYVMWLMETMPEWKKYPLRSRSFICSTNIDYTRSYSGEQGPYLVIPFDGATIGICPSMDFWNGFQGGDERKFDRPSVDYINSQLLDIMQTLNLVRNEDPIKGYRFNRFTKRDFLNLLSSIPYAITDNPNKRRDLEEMGKADNYYKNAFVPVEKNATGINVLKKSFNFIENLKDHFLPEKNGFVCLPFKEYRHDRFNDKEAWLSHRCLFVRVRDNTITGNVANYLNNLRYES